MRIKRKQKTAEETNGDKLIQLMTISLFIILLAFFILLNSIAVINEQKVVAAIGSLLGSFGQKSGGFSVIDGTGKKPRVTSIETSQGRIDFSDLFVHEEILSQEINILKDPRGSIVRIPVDLLFDGANIKIKSSGYDVLRKIADIIQKNDYPVEISGHTDNIPIGKEAGKSNREISAIRSLRTLQYFIETKNIMPHRVTAFGWGEHRPAFSNRTRKTRALNNRMEILFVHRLKKVKPKGGFIFKDFFFQSFD